jgi:ABC-type bacteriocin/lantibiotic exporter with double-glycine peptidase domain
LRNYYPPELANRFFDVLTIQKSLSKILIDFPAAVLQIIFGLILLSFYHPFFIVYGFLLVLLIYIVFKFTAKKGLETSLKESESKYKVAYWIQEVSRSLVSFKLSGTTDLAMKRIDLLTTNYLESRENHFKVLLSQFIKLIIFKVLVTAGLLLIGGLLVLNQQMNIGQFVAAEIIILLVLNSVEKLIKGLEFFYDVLTSLEKIGQVVDKALERQDGENPFSSGQGAHIEFDALGYTTPEGQQVLSAISFTINPSDRILLSGVSGSGKTTLMNILSGLFTPSKGAIYINDISISGVCPAKYRNHIGQVLPSQSPFEGTILENITFGRKDISQEHLHSVLKALGLLSFIKQQINGIHTLISPEGQQIPFTVSKRIVLARAIIYNPKLLLLKDPLEHFEKEEAAQIIAYITSAERPWALVVSGQNELWKQHCNHRIEISGGTIISKK